MLTCLSTKPPKAGPTNGKAGDSMNATLSGLDGSKLRDLQEILAKAITAHWTIRNIFQVVANHADDDTDWAVERQCVYQHLPDAWMGLRRLIKHMLPQEQDAVLRAASVLMADVDYRGCTQETLAVEAARQADHGRLYDALIGKQEVERKVMERLGTLRRYALTKCVTAENQILDVLLGLEKRIESHRTSSTAAKGNGQSQDAATIRKPSPTVAAGDSDDGQDPAKIREGNARAGGDDEQSQDADHGQEAGGDGKGYSTPEYFQRDKWIYEQRKAGRKYAEIERDLRENKHGWFEIEESGIRIACDRYAKHAGLPRIKGQPGRPRKPGKP